MTTEPPGKTQLVVGKTAKWEQGQGRHFEKRCINHTALESEILFLPSILCIFQKQLQLVPVTILPFIEFTGVNRVEIQPLIQGGIKRADNLNR